MFISLPGPASPLHILGLDAVSPLTHIRGDYICVAALPCRRDEGLNVAESSVMQVRLMQGSKEDEGGKRHKNEVPSMPRCPPMPRPLTFSLISHQPWT